MPVIEKAIVREDYMPDAGEAGAGAVVTFEGVVRAKNEGRDVTAIYYDCYREMAEREIADIILETRRTYRVATVRIIHRIGEVAAGETSLLVIVAAAHRKDAFAACSYIVDTLKRRAPIWKKERYADNSARWR